MSCNDQADDFQQHTGYSETIVEEELFHFDDSDDFQHLTEDDITPSINSRLSASSSQQGEEDPETPTWLRQEEEVIIDNVKQVDESEECILDEEDSRRPQPIHLFSSHSPPPSLHMKSPTNMNNSSSPTTTPFFANNNNHHYQNNCSSPSNTGLRSQSNNYNGSGVSTPKSSPSSSSSSSLLLTNQQTTTGNNLGSQALNIAPINFNNCGTSTVSIGSPSKGNNHIYPSKDSDILNLTPINIKTLPSTVVPSQCSTNSVNTPSSTTPPIHGTSTSNISAANMISSSTVMLGSAMHHIMEQQQQHQSPNNTSPRIHIPTMKKDSQQPHHSPTMVANSSVQATPGSPQSKRKFSNGTISSATPTTASTTTAAAISATSVTKSSVVPPQTMMNNNLTSNVVVSTPTSGLANSIGSAISSIASTLTSSLSGQSTVSSASSSSVDRTVISPSSITITNNHHNLRPLTDCCETHKDQKLNTWCHTCGDELICAICAISKHKGHDVDLVEEVYQKEMQDLKNQILQMQQNISEKMEKLARDKGTISHTYEDGVQSINENFDLLEKKLAQKRKELTEKWKICCQDEICENILTSGMQQLSQIKFLTDGFMENLSKMDLSEFIQSKTKKSLLIPVLVQQFQENLRKIDRSYLSDTLDVCVNFDSIKDVMESIDRLGVIGPKNAPPPTNVSSNASTSSTSSPSVHSSPNTPVIPTQEIKCKIEGKFISSFGEKGTEDGQFSSPTDVTVDPNDNIIICDNENNRIQIFDKQGKFLRKFSVPKPYGVTFDAKEGVILVASDDHCVYAFDKSGTEVGKFGSKGSDYGHFSYPTGIVVSETKSQVPGKIIVCDHHNHRIQMFDKYGSFIKSFGTNGTNPEMEGGYFYGPSGLDIDIDGNLVITDRYNCRVQVFTLDGTFVRKFSVKKIENSECDPTGICCLKKNIGLNYAAISDYANNRIQIWNLREGVLIKQFGCYGSEDGQFDGPNGLSITSEGHLVVVDYHNHRVQIFK